MTRLRARRWILIGCGLFMALLIWIAYQAVSTSVHAEFALHAVNLTTVVVDKYVEREGKWPRCWDDLRTVPSVDGFPMYPWPEDWQEVRSYVMVDFDADPAVLAKQSVEEFNAIQPIGPCYNYKHYGYTAGLIETIKKNMVGRQDLLR